MIFFLFDALVLGFRYPITASLQFALFHCSSKLVLLSFKFCYCYMIALFISLCFQCFYITLSSLLKWSICKASDAQ